MHTTLVKWGNSQGFRIPKSVLAELDLHINDTCSISTKGNKLIIEKTSVHKTLEERAAEYGGNLGPYTEIDWGDASGRELW